MTQTSPDPRPRNPVSRPILAAVVVAGVALAIGFGLGNLPAAQATQCVAQPDKARAIDLAAEGHLAALNGTGTGRGYADMAPRDLLEDLVPLASHVVASESAAQLLTGAESPKAAAAALGDSQQAFVAVTAGAEGCWWLDEGQVRHTPAPRIDAVDTLAAGDVFHGAFALGLTEGWAMAEIIRFASAAAALKCTQFGGRLGAPRREAVLAFLET